MFFGDKVSAHAQRNSRFYSLPKPSRDVSPNTMSYNMPTNQALTRDDNNTQFTMPFSQRFFGMRAPFGVT